MSGVSGDGEDRASAVAWPPRTLTELARQGAKRYPLWRVIDEDRSLGLADLAENAARLAGGLRAMGVAAGDHVAIWMSNSCDWLEAWFGIAMAGGTLVPLNTRFTLDEVGYVLRSSDSRWLIRDGGLDAASVGALRKQDGIELHDVVATDGTTAHDLDDLKKYEAIGSVEAGTRVGMIQYTSGSTSFPKGAMLPNHALVRNGYGLGRGWQLTPDDRLLGVNPLFHCGGSVFTFMSAVTSGAPLRLMPKWNPEAAARIMADEGITVFPCIDAMVRDLIGLVRTEGWEWPSLRLVTTAADRAFFEEAITFLGADVSNIYGLTECSPNVCHGVMSDSQERRLGAIGPPQPGLELEIRDPETSEPLPAGSVGEIVVRGWAVMDGYYGNEAATKDATTPDGFLRTGDLGSVDDATYLTYKGRLKLMIKSGGENIAIPEVEEVLREHDAVNDAVVVPVPDARYGEVGYAFVRRLPTRPWAPTTSGSTAAERWPASKCRSTSRSWTTSRAPAVARSIAVVCNSVPRTAWRLRWMGEPSDRAISGRRPCSG